MIDDASCVLILIKVDYKDAEMKAVQDREECKIEAMKQKMKDQEKENQSKVIKLQMEVHASDLSTCVRVSSYSSTPKPLLISPFTFIPT